MYLPKNDVLNELTKLPYEVFDTSQIEILNVPTVTFDVLDNNIVITLNNEISHQTIIIGVDIWAESTNETHQILSEVEEIMRTDLQYRLEFSADVPNIEKEFHHISARFIK